MKYRRSGLIVIIVLIFSIFSSPLVQANEEIQFWDNFRFWLHYGRGLNNHGDALGLGISTQYNESLFSARLIRNYARVSCNEFFELAFVAGFGIKEERYLISGAIGPGLVMKQFERRG